MPITLTKKTTAAQKLDTLEAIEEAIIAASEEASAEHRLEMDIALYQGVYTLSRPFTLDAEAHPGLAHMRITIRPSEGMRPVITSLKGIDARAFTPVSGNIYKYQFEKDENGKYPVFREFYSNGKQLPLAKSNVFIHPFGLPNRKDYSDPANERCLFVPVDEAEKLLSYGEVSLAELTMFLEWEWCSAHVGSIDLDDTREHGGKKYARLTLAGEEHATFIKHQHSCIDIGNREFFFVNHPAHLTEDTFSYNCKTGELYYCLPEGDKIEWKKFSYPTLEQLFILKGLNNVKLEGLTFTGITSKFICENMYYARQSNKEKRFGLFPHAAVLTKNMRDFTVCDCTFRDIDGNGIMMTDSSNKVRIHSSRFYRLSMAGIIVGNHTTAWEDPQNRNYDIEIVNNHLHTIGYEYPAAGAIYVSIVDGLRIMHNTIEKTAYSGITVGWGWSPVSYSLGEKVNIRDAEIAFNRIIDFMQLMRDGAAIYVLGANCTWDHEGQFNFMHDNYAERELYKDASKRGYYMDGSSTNWEVYNNVILGVRLPIFSQFHVANQYTHHNYIHDIYTDYPIDPGNHAPWRDTIVEDCYYVAEGKDAMLEKYPAARSIRDLSGCNLDIPNF